MFYGRGVRRAVRRFRSAIGLAGTTSSCLIAAVSSARRAGFAPLLDMHDIGTLPWNLNLFAAVRSGPLLYCPPMIEQGSGVVAMSPRVQDQYAACPRSTIAYAAGVNVSLSNHSKALYDYCIPKVFGSSGLARLGRYGTELFGLVKAIVAPGNTTYYEGPARVVDGTLSADPARPSREAKEVADLVALRPLPRRAALRHRIRHRRWDRPTALCSYHGRAAFWAV